MESDSEIKFGHVDRYVKKAIGREGVPGLSIGITDAEHTLWTAAHGFSELESKTSATTDDLFQIGSISKFFSSLVLMQLRDEGLIDVRKPVTHYLPWFKVHSKYGRITLHHLLTHTSGLVTGQEESLEGVSEVWALRGTETRVRPGQYFHYSNHGYKTLGLVMERVTGESYGDLIAKRVLSPLGMTSTEAVITNDMRSRQAVGYSPFMDDRPFIPGGRLAPAWWFESGTADGTICSTPADMCRYLRLLLNGGRGPHRRIVSEDSFRLMTAPHIRPEDNAHGESYGYGMNIGKIDGHRCLWHTGGMIGFHASVVADLDSKIGVVTMINGPGVPEDVSFFALRTVRSSLEGTKLPSIPHMPKVPEVKNPRQYAGEYSSEDTKIRISASGKSLWLMRDGRRYRLVPAGTDRFNAMDSSELYPFRFGRDGARVVELFHGSKWLVNAKYRGRTRFPVSKSLHSLAGHYRSTSPWSSNFRVVYRKGGLALIDPYGEEEPLVPIGGGRFRIGADPRCPETLVFDMLVDGKPYLAVRSAGRHFRTFTP